jgi:DNA-directed RNA polymerase specialized sigma24 family protein
VRQDDFKRVFAQCLKDLPPRQAAAFTLREVQGLDTDAICHILDIKPNNLWVLLHRAHLHLRASLATRWIHEPKPIVSGWLPDPIPQPAPSQAS